MTPLRQVAVGRDRNLASVLGDVPTGDAGADLGPEGGLPFPHASHGGEPTVVQECRGLKAGCRLAVFQELHGMGRIR
jgi:hypothetical protein